MNELTNKKIYVTNEYNLFKKLKGNRSVTRPRIEKIKESILTVGYITNPIIVNELKEIIDGQGRSQALEELGLPIEYIVHPGAGINECIKMNIFQEKWKLTDYIDCYADLGQKDYIFLREMITRYNAFNARTIVAICSGNMDYAAEQQLKGGEYKTKRGESDILNLLEYLMKYEPYFKWFSNKDIALKVLAWAYDSQEIDSATMLQKMSLNYQKITPFTCIEECLSSFQKIYNFKNQSKIYMKPLYDEYALSKSAFKGTSHRKNKDQ